MRYRDGILSVALLFCAGVGFAVATGCSEGKPADSGDQPCGGEGKEVDPTAVTEPDNWKPNQEGLSDSDLLAKGLELWEDKSLSKAGNTSCNTCHSSPTALYKKTFAEPYPHEVAMAVDKSGKESVTAAEMVQFCMVVPMGADPLEWDDARLAALTRAVEEKQREYREAIE